MFDIDTDNTFNWRLTPWDSRVFGYPTSEVLDIRYRDKMIDMKNYENNIKLTCFRHDSNDQYLKGIALDNGFNITEFSMYIKHNDISRIPKRKIVTRIS